MKERYVELRWKLLEYKAMYYLPEKIHPSRHQQLTISDSEYDALEKEMLALDESLGYNNGRIVGFPSDKPSGELVLKKLLTELNERKIHK